MTLPTAKQRKMRFSKLRFRGCLLGLAAGDAVGTTVEFEGPGTFPPVTDMVGGGPFHLKPGEWTDDTSMALCLAESLIERRSFDPHDQMTRYVAWWRTGHLGSNGRCFDIGNTVKAALTKFTASGEPYCGSTAENTAGNGSLMRLAPMPMALAADPEKAIELAALSSRTTHGARVSVDACRYMTGLMIGALRGATKEQLLSPLYSPTADGSRYWEEHPLCPEIEAIARGSFRREPPEIKGTGYAAHSLEAALWAFATTDDFAGGCLAAVNLGDDADTTAAVYGQLAGAFYGERGIPVRWRAKLARRDLLERYADALLALAAKPA